MASKVAQPASAAVGKKGGEEAGPNASMKTAVTMGETGANRTQTTTLMNGSNMAGSLASPFKETLARGVVSGMGMLTF